MPTVSLASAMILIYIFKYPQPGQEDEIFNPSTGSAREEDMAKDSLTADKPWKTWEMLYFRL